MKIAKLKDINEAEMKDKKPWKPIKTAPKNERILVWNGVGMHVAHWAKNVHNGDEAYIIADCGNEGEYQLLTKPTHWMPLPSQPTKEEIK